MDFEAGHNSTCSNYLLATSFTQLRNCQKWRTLRRSKLHSKCDHFSARPANFSCGGPLGSGHCAQFECKSRFQELESPLGRSFAAIRTDLSWKNLSVPSWAVSSKRWELINCSLEKGELLHYASTHAGERPRQEGVAKFGGFFVV